MLGEYRYQSKHELGGGNLVLFLSKTLMRAHVLFACSSR